MTQLAPGQVNLDDPATTLALLKLNAVVGVTGFFDAERRGSASVGIQVRAVPLHGRRQLRGRHRPPARRLARTQDSDIGALVASATDFSPYSVPLGVSQDTVPTVLRGWGRGKFDPFVVLDGKATRPDCGSAAVLIPGLFHLRGTGLVTWNGWSGIASWVPLVINLALHGKGVFSDRRLTDATQFPVAAANGYARIVNSPYVVTSKLPSLLAYVESIHAPKAPVGSFDTTMAAAGQELFTGKAKCSGCHAPPINTTPGWTLCQQARLASTRFKPTARPITATAPLHSTPSSPQRRAAISTTVASPRSMMSSPTSIRTLRRGLRATSAESSSST